MAHIYKRSNTWTARITKRIGGKLIQSSKGGFKTKAEAKSWATEQEALMLKGVDIANDPTLVQFFNEWYHTFKEKSVTSSTKKRYVTHGRILSEYFKNTKLKDIKRTDYQRFLNWFGESHAPGTVHKLDTMIIDCISSAIADGLISMDFTAKTIIAGDDSRTRHVEYLNLDEIKRLISLCYENRQPRYTSPYMIITAIYTGMRLGEISALNWSDIDFSSKQISITKSWNQDRREMSKPKTESSIRTVPVNSWLLELITELKVNECDFVFGNPLTGFPPTSQAINQALRRFLKQGNMEKRDFHFHSLRHSHVAFLLNDGVDIYAISQRLGHANIAITLKVYAYLLDDQKQKEDDKIISSLDSLNK